MSELPIILIDTRLCATSFLFVYDSCGCGRLDVHLDYPFAFGSFDDPWSSAFLHWFGSWPARDDKVASYCISD